MIPLALSIVLVVGWSNPMSATVRLTEIMSDPDGSEVSDEFVEFRNVGSSPVDLTGWRVGDGESVDDLLPVRSAILQPGQYGLVLDADYSLDSGIYGPLPAESLVFVVGDPTFGHSGFSNVHGEAVVLIDASGDTVDVHTYSLSNEEGVSEERVDDRGDWMPAKWTGGTPGRTNSVSPKATDLAVEPAAFAFIGGVCRHLAPYLESRGASSGRSGSGDGSRYGSGNWRSVNRFGWFCPGRGGAQSDAWAASQLYRGGGAT